METREFGAGVQTRDVEVWVYRIESDEDPEFLYALEINVTSETTLEELRELIQTRMGECLACFGRDFCIDPIMLYHIYDDFDEYGDCDDDLKSISCLFDTTDTFIKCILLSNEPPLESVDIAHNVIRKTVSVDIISTRTRSPALSVQIVVTDEMFDHNICTAIKDQLIQDFAGIYRDFRVYEKIWCHTRHKHLRLYDSTLLFSIPHARIECELVHLQPRPPPAPTVRSRLGNGKYLSGVGQSSRITRAKSSFVDQFERLCDHILTL